MIKLNGAFGELVAQGVFGLRSALKVLFVGVLLVMSSALTNADTIQILLPDGKPATDAKVQWRTVEWNDGKTKATVKTFEVDAAGNVEMEDLAEMSQSVNGVLIVDHPDAAIGLWNFGIKGKLTLTPAFKIAGSLVGADGSAVTAGNVRMVGVVTLTYTGVFELFFRDLPRFCATVNQDGKFEFRGVTLNGYQFPPGGRLFGEGKINGQRHVGMVMISLAGDSKNYLNSDFKTQRKPEPPIELAVHPLGSVSGVVVNGHDGTPVVGGEIKLGGPSYTGEIKIKTKADGSFELNGVPTYSGRSFSIEDYYLLEPNKKERQGKERGINVSGLRLPIYPMKVQTSKLVSSDTGKPPVIPLELGYRQVIQVGSGWKLLRAGSWGNIGAEAKTKTDGSFQMSLPTGPFEFIAKAPSSNARGAYDWSGDMNLAADEELPTEFPVQRSRGILFKTLLPTDRKLNDPIWRTFVVSFKVEGGTKYTSDTPLWFVPVKEWGDEVELKVEQRPRDQERRTMVDWTKFKAVSDKDWPVEIEFPGAVLGK